MSRYVLLNQQFCEANQNAENETGKFGFAITLANEYVCAEQTLIDFPELFTGEILLPGIIIIERSITEFPSTNTLPPQ